MCFAFKHQCSKKDPYLHTKYYNMFEMLLHDVSRRSDLDPDSDTTTITTTTWCAKKSVP